jgi:hypothetical protein
MAGLDIRWTGSALKNTSASSFVSSSTTYLFRPQWQAPRRGRSDDIFVFQSGIVGAEVTD